MRVRLTKDDRWLLEIALTMDLPEATSFEPDKFTKVHKAIAALRDDLINSVRNDEQALNGCIAAINRDVRYGMPD